MTATLAIVACGPQLEVALASSATAVPSVIRLCGATRRSSMLMAAVDLLMEDAQLSRDALSIIAVSRGPGSFTGIRSGLASAAGLARAVGAQSVAVDSLFVQAGRMGCTNEVWAAQPGRRGEIYARPFRIPDQGPPEALAEVDILRVDNLSRASDWVAPDGLDLGSVPRPAASFGAAEALLRLSRHESVRGPLEALYVEDPPPPPSRA